MSKKHQLWLNLNRSKLRDGRFYNLFRKMLYSDISVISSGIPESYRIVFPSDKDWQNKIYLQLVEKQRRHDAALKQQEDDE